MRPRRRRGARRASSGWPATATASSTRTPTASGARNWPTATTGPGRKSRAKRPSSGGLGPAVVHLVAGVGGQAGEPVERDQGRRAEDGEGRRDGGRGQG